MSTHGLHPSSSVWLADERGRVSTAGIRTVLTVRANTIEHAQRPDLGLVYRLPERARDAVLNVADERGVLPYAVSSLLRSLAIGHASQIEEDIVARFGRDASAVARRTAECVADPFHGGIYLDEPPEAILWLKKVPDWYFLRFIEQAVKQMPNVLGTAAVGRDLGPYIRAFADDINNVLRGAGDVYRLGDDGVVRLVDEPLIDETILEPALGILVQPRLNRVAADFDAALTSLAGGRKSDFEKAITEASNAVEGMLAVLMDERGVTSRGDGTHARFVALRDADVLPGHVESIVTGASRMRNKDAGHSHETTPRAADEIRARATVQAAAVAIVFLGGVRQS